MHEGVCQELETVEENPDTKNGDSKACSIYYECSVTDPVTI